jgi:adenosylhomocysteine nucleosidase
VTIIAVSGLLRETRIAAGPGVRTLAGGGNVASLRDKLEQAIAEGATGIISFGIAGGLAPSLKSGDCVLGLQVLEAGTRFICDEGWTARLAESLPDAMLAPIAGVDAVMTTKSAKADLFRETGARAVDMESHVVARLAQAHRLPFVVLRTIADPWDSALPPLATAAVTDEGRIHLAGMLKSLLGNPRQIAMLPRTARESQAAFDALLRCRRALGLRLLGPDGGELPLDMG